MRILFTTVPVFGHFLPMTPLVDAARRAGHEVVVASGTDIEVEVKRLGVEFWRVGPTLAEAVAEHRVDEENLSPEERIAADVSAFFVPQARASAQDLVPRAVAWRPDLVVHEPSALAGGIAAAVTGARQVVHGLGMWPAGIWSIFAPGYTALCAEWSVADRYLDATYLDILPAGLQARPDFPEVLALRPAPPPSQVTTAPAIPDQYPNTVYLTLGTIFHEAADVFRAALDGLTSLPVNVFVTTGPNADPARVGEWPAHVQVTDFVPQELVLPHCRVAVHHGGAGSMLGALRHGLPQLILPRGADNFHNAALAESAGVALSLAPDEIGAQAVADAVTRLMTEPGFGERARRVSEDIAAMPGADEVLSQLTR
ncbi:glycosyltransferase [Actinophytocola sp.]|uniref:glycosyltransferase n=1 Tax=Actinophytocola sp. TaxID=1872138 RepID=UPI002ED0448F